MSPHNRHILAFTPLGQASALETAVNKYMFPLDSLINIFVFFLTILGVKPRTLYTLCKHHAMEQHPQHSSILLTYKGLKNTFTHERFTYTAYGQRILRKSVHETPLSIYVARIYIYLESDTDRPIFMHLQNIPASMYIYLHMELIPKEPSLSGIYTFLHCLYILMSVFKVHSTFLTSKILLMGNGGL